MTETKQTEYVVLGRTDIEIPWTEVGRATAANARAAVVEVVEETGEYVAVPARSFQPVQVTVEQKPKLSFGEPLASRKAPEPEPA